MTPATLVQRIINLGLNEDAPDTGLQTKALGWLNSAYHEAYNTAASFATPYLAQSETITVTNGTGAFSTAPRRILFMRDTQSNRILKMSDYASIAINHPGLTTQGNPAKYYLTGATGFKTFPKNNTTVEVGFIPRSVDLTLTSTEADIKIPPHHHDMLIWSALIEAMTYERGFGNEALLQVAAAKKNTLTDNYVRELRDSAMPPQRTAYQDL